jgi:trehalose 6-phosphate phosphatase
VNALPGLPEPLTPLAADPRHSALCLDFDGTLAGIVGDPAAARPLPGVPALLAELARHLAVVAVISGRPVDFLQRVLGEPKGVRLVGLYGLEWVDADGNRQRAPGSAPWQDVITQAVARAPRAAPAGVGVEPKGLTLTLHWRHAPESRHWVETFVAEEVDTHHLAAHQARQSIELGPPLAVDKGTVVRSLAEGMRAVAAFGDDLGDLPAFGALTDLAAQGVAVARVAVVDRESPPEVADASDLLVQGAPGAVALLEQLLRAVS